MIQYHEILEEVLAKGTWKAPARQGSTKTISRFGIQKRFNLAEGFPLVTTKKVGWKGILHELLWFLNGDTNIKYLVDNNVNIWNEDAYRYYLLLHKKVTNWSGSLSFQEFIEAIKKGDLHKSLLSDSIYREVLKFNHDIHEYKLGDLGPVYGKQWRDFGGVDQIKNVINGIKANPESRYHIVSAWNPGEIKKMALPPCHMLFMFNCRTDVEGKEYIDCDMTQRSCDTFLGVPYNIASYAFLTHIIARLTNKEVGDFIWNGKDVHIYEDHLDQVKEQLSREPKKLPMLSIVSHNWHDIKDIQFNDFQVLDYDSDPKIEGKLISGLSDEQKA